MGRLKKMLLRNLLLFPLIRPDFIAYELAAFDPVRRHLFKLGVRRADARLDRAIGGRVGGHATDGRECDLRGIFAAAGESMMQMNPWALLISLVLGVIEFFVIQRAFREWLGMRGWIVALMAAVASYVPLVGGVIACAGAFVVLEWSWWLAAGSSSAARRPWPWSAASRFVGSVLSVLTRAAPAYPFLSSFAASTANRSARRSRERQNLQYKSVFELHVASRFFIIEGYGQ